MSATTKRLLACGIVGGPVFVTVAIVQAVTRRGFDLAHQSLSMLSLGGAGWIQIANFLVAGALAIACATGLRRLARERNAGPWAARLAYVYGAGLIVGGVFHPDAGAGFPPGTPANQGVVRTAHGALHIASGTIAFISLIVVCFLLARILRDAGLPRQARVSRVVAVVFAICVVAASAPGGSLILFVGAGVAMLWLAVAAQALIRYATATDGERPRVPGEPQLLGQLG
jgi:Protein of unknown function (DUF998)